MNSSRLPCRDTDAPYSIQDFEVGEDDTNLKSHSTWKRDSLHFP
jgi:hypothetical protein